MDEDDDAAVAETPSPLDLTLPLTFTIGIPSPAQRTFGRESTAGPLRCFIAYRANTLERDRVALAAQACGVSASTFMRHIVMSVVSDIEAHQAQNKSTIPNT